MSCRKGGRRRRVYVVEEGFWNCKYYPLYF
jgi:hypothetical protein